MSHSGCYVGISGFNIPIVVAAVGECAVLAVFVALLSVAKITAATAAEHVQRAIAEKAVEIIRIVSFMAREIFALDMRKKRILGHPPLFVVH